MPRHDLLPASRIIGYVESSRNCNFRCSFCAMTAEDRAFIAYDLDDIRRQIDALGYRQCVMFLDQNFFGGPRSYFAARMALLKELFEQGKFGGWAALVTADFFANADNLARARESGCIGFFSGVESFSRVQLTAFNKKQNLLQPQEEIIQSCLEAGLVFHYGLIFDLVEQRIDELLAETDFIVANPHITLPSFLGFAIPMLAHRLQEASVLRGAMVMTAAVFAIYPFAATPWMMAGCAMLLGLALGAVQPMIMSALHHLTPSHRHGEAIGFRSMAINLSSSVMPLGFGLAGTALGPAAVFWLMGAAVGAGSWAVAGLKRAFSAPAG